LAIVGGDDIKFIKNNEKPLKGGAIPGVGVLLPIEPCQGMIAWLVHGAINPDFSRLIVLGLQ